MTFLARISCTERLAAQQQSREAASVHHRNHPEFVDRSTSDKQAYTQGIPSDDRLQTSADKLPGQNKQGRVGSEAQAGEQGDAVARGAKPLGGRLVGVGRVAVAGGVDVGRGEEELAVALVAAVDGDEHDGGAVDGEEGADGVELGREDLEDDEGEGELAQGRAHVGALKGALGCADLDEFIGGEDYGAGAVEAEVEVVFGVGLEHDGQSSTLNSDRDEDESRSSRLVYRMSLLLIVTCSGGLSG